VKRATTVAGEVRVNSRRGRDTEPPTKRRGRELSVCPDHDALRSGRTTTADPSYTMPAVLLSCCVHPSTHPSPSRPFPPVSFFGWTCHQLPRSIPRNGRRLRELALLPGLLQLERTVIDRCSRTVSVCARVQQAWYELCTAPASSATNLYLHRVVTSQSSKSFLTFSVPGGTHDT
jgi:hypothetical protein